MNRLCLLTLALAGLHIGAGTSQAAGSPAGEVYTNTGAVLLLPFADEIGTTDTAHWKLGIGFVLARALRELRTLEVLDFDDADFACASTGLARADRLSVTEASALGRRVSASSVIWGSYRRQSGQLSVELHVSNLSRANGHSTITVKSPNWLELLRSATAQLLKELPVSLSEDEKSRVGNVWPKSEAALEAHARAGAALASHAPLEEAEPHLRKAIEEDPQFSAAYLQLAQVLDDLDRHEPAQKVLKQMLELPRQVSHGYCLLSTWRVQAEDATDLEAALDEAARREPDCFGPWVCRGMKQANEGKFDDALLSLAQARTLHPRSGMLAAIMALIAASAGKTDKVLEYYDQAVNLARNDRKTYGTLIVVSGKLGDMSRLIQNYRAWHALAVRQRAGQAELEYVQGLLDKAHLSLNNILKVPQPRQRTGEELKRELEQRLSPAELALAVNPLEANEAMKAWARQLICAVPQARDKALLLFAELASGERIPGHRGNGTALETFGKWKEVPQKFSCQEYSSLYVALARQVGLDAFFVHVGRDAGGKIVRHDCAIVFLDEGAVLVDPSLRQFGVQHKEFVVLDDLQTIAHHACQPKKDGNDVARCRLGLKLHDAPWVRAQLVFALAEANRLEEARLELASIPRAGLSDTDQVYLLIAEGLVLGRAGQDEKALEPLQQAVRIAPEFTEVHFLLAEALIRLKQIEPARLHYNRVLALDDGANDQQYVRKAKQALEELAEAQAAGAGDTNSLAALRTRAETGNPVAQYNLAVALLRSEPPKTEEAIAWLQRAGDQGDPDACHLLFRIYSSGQGVSRDERVAADWVRKSAEAGSPDGMFDLGVMLYEGKAVEKDVVDAHKWLCLAAAKGHRQSKYLLQELEIFMTPEQLRHARDDSPPKGRKN